MLPPVSNELLLDTTSNKKVSSLAIMYIRIENKIFHIKAQLHIFCGNNRGKDAKYFDLTIECT